MPIDLSAFDDQYTAATPPEQSHDEVPDGRYQATLEMLELVQTKTTNKPMFKFQFKILAGDHAGRMVFKQSVIQPTTLDYVKKDLSLLGFAGKLSELEQPEGRMLVIGKTVEIGVRTKGTDDQGRPNRDVFINKGLTLAAGAGGQPPF